MKSYKSTCSL